MNFIDIIDKKKKCGKLNRAEIRYFVKGAADKSIPDYQLSALLMAIRINGMDERETYALTKEMELSGDVLDTSFAGGITCDKHSTGGVSDTVTLVAVPALAVAGLKIIKLSGRGLSYTGGTADKLESIPGFKTDLSEEKIKKCVLSCGAVMCTQTGELAPADKALYALRDVTSTVDSIPLIASSVMSKKLAAGNKVILLDVKYGSGAFMKTAEEAANLARLMVGIGIRDGKKCAAVVSSMEQPLTESVGCNLEVQSAVNVLKGEKNGLYTVSKEVCARIMLLAGKSANLPEAYLKFDEIITSGAALSKFEEIITCQGGNPEALHNPDILKPAKYKKEVFAKESGYAVSVNAELIGKAVCRLGGGREEKGAGIDHGAGLKFFVRLNGYVNKGDIIAELYASDAKKFAEAERLMESCYGVSEKPEEQGKLLYAYVSSEGTELL